MNNLRKCLHLSVLFLILISTLFLVLPTIHHHINDPNAIVYFNNDEGYQMDLIWSYYSGEIRPSYAGNVDYGLEMVYIADICRLFLPRFIDFTPGLLVVIMRWLHLLGWLSALIAFWRMVGRHFNRGWQRSAATLLLAVHPAFAYFSINNKPDLLVFLFMIIGLDYSLRLVERPPQERSSKKVLLISVASAAMAVIIKFAGFFLLPAIVAALYLGRGGKRGKGGEREGSIANKVLSDGFIVFAIFSVAISIFGFRWFLMPAHFINTYLQNGVDFLGGFMIRDVPDLAGFVKTYVLILVKRFVSFDMIILSLFGIYLFMEFFFEKKWKKEGLSFKPDQRKKRLILIIYLVPFLLSIFTPGRFTVHHALPFFAAIYILIFEGMGMAMFVLRDMVKWQMAKGLAKIALTLLVVFDISVNARRTVRERVSQFHQREDVSFEISEWWQQHIPPEEKVITDHMARVYVPPGHKNIRVFRGYQTNWLEQLRSIVKEGVKESRPPRYLYYNEGPSGGDPFPSIGEMLPGQKVRLVRLFEGKERSPQGRKYQRYKGDRFLIYELIY